MRVSLDAVALQRFHANQMAAEEPCGPLATLIAALAANPDAALTTSDGGGVNGPELHTAITSLAAMLDARGLTLGARLSIQDTAHPLAAPLVLSGLARGLHVVLGPVEDTTRAALVVGPGPAALPFESEDGAACVADGMIETPDPLQVLRGGTLTLIVAGRAACIGADWLAEAALSLSAAVLPTEPLPGIAAFSDLLASLAAFGSARSVLIRV